MSMPQLLFRLLILVPDLGCTIVCLTARVCLGTVLTPSFQPAAQAPWVFLSATSVSGRQWSCPLTGSCPLRQPHGESYK
jgi:hypothetical protein